jgi:hypothetical protein
VDDFEVDSETVKLDDCDPETVTDSDSVNDRESEVKDKERDRVGDNEEEKVLDNESDVVPDMELDIDALGLGLREALCVGVWDAEKERECEREE